MAKTTMPRVGSLAHLLVAYLHKRPGAQVSWFAETTGEQVTACHFAVHRLVNGGLIDIDRDHYPMRLSLSPLGEIRARQLERAYHAFMLTMLSISEMNDQQPEEHSP